MQHTLTSSSAETSDHVVGTSLGSSSDGSKICGKFFGFEYRKLENLWEILRDRVPATQKSVRGLGLGVRGSSTGNSKICGNFFGFEYQQLENLWELLWVRVLATRKFVGTSLGSSSYSIHSRRPDQRPATTSAGIFRGLSPSPSDVGRSVCGSNCLSVCLPGKCTVAKWLIGTGCGMRW